VHGTVQHLGKGPVSDGEGFEARKALQELYLKLQKAIQSEAFEEAAKIRDRIKKMEQENA
jgi:protein arginine kinase activator